MLEIAKMLLPLAVVVVINIALGTYYNISIQDIKFDKFKLLNGIFKALIVGGSFVGLAYVVSAVQLGDFSIDPKLIMITAIGTYGVKSAANLCKVLGIAVPTKA
jgi:hypothetical protein